MEISALERLARCSSQTEIWWDSSPLIYPRWRASFGGAHPELGEQLDALFHPEGEPWGYLRGSTTNQPITLQALDADPDTWRAWAVETAALGGDPDARRLAAQAFGEIVRRGAGVLSGLFASSGRRFGYICGQVDPRLDDDTDAMVQQAIALKALAPNIMIKMPGTAAGIEGVRQLTAHGIATTTTLSFSVPQLVAVAEAVEAGLRLARAHGVDLSSWRATGVMMLGRFEDHPAFRQQASEHGIDLSPADMRWAGIAIFKEAYRLYQRHGYQAKLLAASMRIGPEIAGREYIWHLEKLAGADAVLTIFPNIIEGYLLGYRDRTVEPMIGEEVPRPILDRLLRIPYFRQAYEEDGLKPEEFASYPPVVATTESFTKGMQDFESRIAAFAQG